MQHISHFTKVSLMLCWIGMTGVAKAQHNLSVTTARGHDPAFSVNSHTGSKIAHKLWQLQETTERNKQWRTTADSATFTTLNIRENEVRVIIEAESGTDMKALETTLGKNGFSAVSVFENMIGGYIGIGQLGVLDKIAPVSYVYPATRAMRRSGNALSQADKAARADIARQFYGVNGAGVKIGLISDSYNNDGMAEQGVRDGELPGSGNPEGFVKPVVVMKDYRSPFALDEGRALAEIVHDVAPGSELYYYTGYIDQVDFAAGILALADAGCKIIVDDVIYFDEPFFQDGIVNRAITRVKKRGVSYFTACGNSGSIGYERRFKPVNGTLNGAPVAFHNFSGSNQAPVIALQFTLPAFFVTGMVLQWDEPYYAGNRGGAKTDLDLLVAITDDNGTTSFIDDADNTGGSPYSFVGIFNNEAHPVTMKLYVIRKGGSTAPRYIKIVDMNGGAKFLPGETVPGINAGTVVGHSNSADAISVGAAYYRKTQAFGAVRDSVQRYSSRGNTPIFFTPDGRPDYELRLKPDVVAADGANTSFFGFDFDGDGFPNFAGTSAAAPVAAAVGALAMEAAKCRGPIHPNLLKWVMLFSTNDMDDPATPRFDYGYDRATGFGFLRADDVVRFFNRCNRDNDDRSAGEDMVSTVSIFPNPVVDVLQVRLRNTGIARSSAAYTIVDAGGRQVLTGLLKSADLVNNIPVRMLLPGGYYISIKQEGVNTVTRFFMKQ